MELGKIMCSMSHSIWDVERHFSWPVHVNITTFSRISTQENDILNVKKRYRHKT